MDVLVARLSPKTFWTYSIACSERCAAQHTTLNIVRGDHVEIAILNCTANPLTKQLAIRRIDYAMTQNNSAGRRLCRPVELDLRSRSESVLAFLSRCSLLQGVLRVQIKIQLQHVHSRLSKEVKLA